MPNHTLVIPSPHSQDHTSPTDLPPTGTRQDRLLWLLLRDGVPVTLLCDLLFRAGPPSRQILASEALADDVRLSHPEGGSIGGHDLSITGM